ncbi:hypothetical protein PG994_006099 [Apiospora phragmitis]|uniref:GPI anchored serine-threonine rich protein n=1 Tax=Apiospora phragmitis TaxID=2905665 RepID=A0ABR1VHV3_9PEZI
MKFTLPALLMAVTVSAQSASDTSSTCAAANIVDACLETTTGYLSQCTDNADYQCKCDKYTAIMTCFNNCPNDTRAASYANSKQLYCMNASLYSSQTATATTTGSTSAPVSAAATTTSAAAAGTDKVGAAATGASSSAGAKSTDAAKNGVAEVLSNTSGLMLAVAAIIAAVL